ncbi:hypothetical protein JCM3766R1_002802 [Sporobolomyces carnicolor]
MNASVARRAVSDVLKKRPDDVVIVTALRTPIGKFRGGLKDMHAEELLSHVLKSTRERLEGMGVDVKGGAVQDIHNGTVLMELGGAKSGRLASLDAGFPIVSGFKSVNRQCASSLQATTDIAISIKAGLIDMGIASGSESMTRDYGTRAIPVGISPFIAKSSSQDAQDCLAPMGTTSEAVAERYNIPRQRQDEFAVKSHAKAKKAQDEGLLAAEIAPIKVRKVTPAEGEKAETTEEVTLSKDEGIRPQTTMESLAKLKTVFKENGTGTAGNSSQISDGASALTLVRRDVAEKLGLKPIARWVGSAVVGVPPIIMGVGPAYATPKLLERFGLSTNDIDIWELNEAFASQSLMVMDTLKLDESKVNPKGGAIALGHPLGATGGRLLTSLITELQRTGKNLGVATLCMGTGAGKATLIAPRDDETSKAAWFNFRNRVATVRTAREGNEGGDRRDFGFLPVPARCRFDESFKFSILLNCMLSLTSMLTVANIYYPQPILVQLSDRYNVEYDRVTRVTSLLQAGYLVGLVFITPLGDLVRRRSLLLLLVLATASLALGQATVSSFAGFEALSFIQGLFTVTPQILNPLTADLAPSHRRATVVSITVSGLISGMVVGRVFSGVITKFTNSPNNIYYFASGTQFALLVMLYCFLPDFPKKRTGLNYFEILWSMVRIFFTSPVLIQACFVGTLSCAIFVSWWTSLTFLLNDSPFQYNTFEIGLFGLCGIVAVAWAPIAGRFTDRLNPWLVSFLALIGQAATGAIAVGAAGLNLAPVIICCIFVDVFQQTMTLGQQARIYAIDPLSRGRINGVYMAFVFAGQATGSSAGPKMFLRYGWRACYSLHLGFNALALLVLLARGPNAKGWIGWSGNYSLRKVRPREEDFKGGESTMVELERKEEVAEGKTDDEAEKGAGDAPGEPAKLEGR